MVSLEIRAFFVVFLFFEHAPLQLEGRPPPTPLQPSPQRFKPTTFRPNTGHLTENMALLGPPSAASHKSQEEMVPMLNIALLSASVGKYFLNRKKNISAECHETAMTVVQLWQRLPIVRSVEGLIHNSYMDIVGDSKNLQALKNPVAVVCDTLEKRFSGDAALSHEFWRLREELRRHGTNKANTSVTSMPKSNDGAKQLIADEFEDPVIGTLLAHIAFVNQLNAAKASSQESHLWAEAILTLAKDEGLKEVVQRLYDKTRTQTADNITSPARKHKPANSIMRVFEDEMMSNLKENFENDNIVKTDFQMAVNKLRATT